MTMIGSGSSFAANNLFFGKGNKGGKKADGQAKDGRARNRPTKEQRADINAKKSEEAQKTRAIRRGQFDVHA